MATGIIIVIVIVLLIAAAVAGTLALSRRKMRQRFGAEYDQLASQVGGRKARAQLAERERRVAQLDIHPLSPERRTGYGREWTSLQDRFIDSPAQSVEAAAALVSAVAADRGYPADDDRLLDDLSVHHADRLDGYRRARGVTEQAGTAGTEELRQALLGYRALFRDLLGPEPAAGQAGGKAEPAPAASGARQPATAIARTLRARGDGTDSATTAVADGTDSGSAADSAEPWVDSGRDDAAASAARKE